VLSSKPRLEFCRLLTTPHILSYASLTKVANFGMLLWIAFVPSRLRLQWSVANAILLLWMWNAFAVICVGTMLMLVPLPNSVVHVQLSARVVVRLDIVLRIVNRPRADRLTRCAGYVIMVTRLGWQSCRSGLDAVSPLFGMLNRGNFHLRPQVLCPGAKSMLNRGNFHLRPQVLCLGVRTIQNRGNFHLRPQVLSPGAKRLQRGIAPLTAEAKHDAPLVKFE
jgi:hypothetical protein